MPTRDPRSSYEAARARTCALLRAAAAEQARREAEVDRERLRAEAETESAARTRADADRDRHEADRKELQRRIDALSDELTEMRAALHTRPAADPAAVAAALRDLVAREPSLEAGAPRSMTRRSRSRAVAAEAPPAGAGSE